jgi:hypothetical protein
MKRDNTQQHATSCNKRNKTKRNETTREIKSYLCWLLLFNHLHQHALILQHRQQYQTVEVRAIWVMLQLGLQHGFQIEWHRGGLVSSLF